MGSTTVDLTVMHLLHDAFRRDLDALTRAAAALDDDPVAAERIAIGWHVLADQLHHHHTVEDDQLWPLVRRSWDRSPDALDVLDAMEPSTSSSTRRWPRSATPSRPGSTRVMRSIGCARWCATTSTTRSGTPCRSSPRW